MIIERPSYLEKLKHYKDKDLILENGYKKINAIDFLLNDRALEEL